MSPTTSEGSSASPWLTLSADSVTSTAPTTIHQWRVGSSSSAATVTPAAGQKAAPSWSGSLSQLMYSARTR